MSDKRHIIITVQDAKLIAKHLPDGQIKRRLEAETGGDITEICERLKKRPFCHACVVEGQEQYCESLTTKKIGRRLKRLLDRADNKEGE